MGYISFVPKFLSEIQKCTKSEAFLSEQIISEPVKRRMDFERKSNSYLIFKQLIQFGSIKIEIIV